MAASVLVVDDDLDIRTGLQRLLQNAGFEVSLAANGHDALVYMESRPPRLIVLDLTMPGMDGWDFLDAAEPVVPVIVISGANDLKKRPLRGNVVARMSKPFDVVAFLAAVNKYCPSTENAHPH